jgi:SAM-dependent methyltransferase
LKHAILRNLIPLGLYPHIGFTYSPFKILEFRAMLEQANLQGTEKALDIGCGDGLHTLLIGQRVGEVTGIDVNPEFIKIARRYGGKISPRVKTEFRDQPLEDCGFADTSFDVIFSICVIEHIPNYREVLEHCLRILKPGCRIVFTVDTLEGIDDPQLIESHRQAHHVQQYFRKDTLRALLEEIGFEVLHLENMFRSPLARSLFTEGIREGFNFGRLRAQRLANKLEAAERQTPLDEPGMFLLATARKPEV